MTHEELKARRARLELSQGTLAKRLGVDRSYIAHAENDEGFARPWYHLALLAIEYEERLVPLPRKWTKPACRRGGRVKRMST
ncbi:MAG: helix-turn-helix domain-containing protein [Thermoleophilia bacterium]|nr:helix-turn-helix domain-containing protein [Thermoleophilia bacterium]